MAKFRQHDISGLYAEGVDAAVEQLNNNGMGYPETDPSLTTVERAEFFRGYKDTLNESNKR